MRSTFNLERRRLGDGIGTVSQYLTDWRLKEELGFLCVRFQSTVSMEIRQIWVQFQEKYSDSVSEIGIIMFYIFGVSYSNRSAFPT